MCEGGEVPAPHQSCHLSCPQEQLACEKWRTLEGEEGEGGRGGEGRSMGEGRGERSEGTANYSLAFSYCNTMLLTPLAAIIHYHTTGVSEA